MNTMIRFAALVLVAGLAGCQHAAPARPPAAVDPQPPAMGSTSTRAPATGTTATSTRSPAVATTPPGAASAGGARAVTPARTQAPAAQKQSAAVITLHLAQERPEASLVAVDVGGASLYALPQPVITQADIARVTPVTGKDQRTFILLEMNARGMPKLQSVTQQARGHYLLLSVQGQLVNVARISETINDGRLMVGTQNDQHTRAIINLMQGQ